MREQFMSMIRDLKNTDFHNNPNIVTTRRLFELLNEPLGPDLACVVVASFLVEVDNSFTDDKELFDTVLNDYVEMIVRIKAEMDAIHSGLFESHIKRKELKLQYKG